MSANRPPFPLAAVWLIAASVTSSACSTEGSTATSDHDASAIPECVPRVPRDPATGEYSTDALPSGACDGKVPECTLGARVICPCKSFSAGPYDGYTCTCTSGAWACTVTSPGGSVCVCTDAGDDGGADGGA